MPSLSSVHLAVRVQVRYAETGTVDPAPQGRPKGSGKRGAWFLFLPKYAPDLNSIEMAFAKLRTLLRKAKARNRSSL